MPCIGYIINMKQLNRSVSLILAFVMLLSMVYLAPAPHTHAATASSYIATSYAANLSVKTTQTANLCTYPSTDSTAAKYTLPASTMLTVKALHKSTAGTYWYEVLYYDMTLYIDATACTLVDHLTGDVTIANVQSPASLAYGDSFPISGDISSTLNDLGTISAAMYTSSNITKDPYMISSDEADSDSYSLYGSTVDANMVFGSLEPGVYTYVVTAEAISYYIDDSDALATSAQTVVLETQQCVVTDWENPNDALAFGIDVSTWNGVIDWAAVAADGVDYAILRIGYEETLDDTFIYNAQGCMENDIPFGVYVYSYAESESEGIGEANFIINTLKTYGLKCDLPIWFDMEDAVHTALSTSEKQATVKGFCDTIYAAGLQPGLYTFISWFNSYFTDSYYDSLPKWIAQIDGYSSNGTSTFDGGTWMWQYSWVGSISGISGDVDCNYYYAEIPGYFSSDTSYLSKCTHYPARSIGTTTSSVNLRSYPSTSYSSLGTVASGTEVEITGLYKNASGEYWYQVVNGSTAGYISASYITIDEFLYDDLAVIDPAMASNINLGSAYSLSGDMVSQYNTIYTAYARIYSGEDTLADPVLSSSYTTNSKYYNLYASEVDYDLPFNQLSAGYYTYEISADVKNYYVSGSSLTSKTENVVLWTAPFTVGSAPIEPPADVACDHNIVTDAAVAATCTESGLSEGSHCSACGVVFSAQTVVPATGHSYTITSTDATCQDYQVFHYSCSGCGNSFDLSANELTDWQESMPEGIDSSLIESKTQYRYADCTSTTWQQSGTKSVKYVDSWPSGFDTSNSLYSTYNKKSSKVTASTGTTTKTVVDSDAVVGYLWYHWCTGSTVYTKATKQDSYTTFHAVYSTTCTPSNYDNFDSSDDSYSHTSLTACSCSTWYWPVEVYEQKSTSYTAVPDGQEWGSWSAWSDTVYTAVTNSRKVETRTLYRLKKADLGDHVWDNGVCSVCGVTCTHSFVDGICSECGTYENISFYLVGMINGYDYGYGTDSANTGIYQFVDGKLVVTFTSVSYVAVKPNNDSALYLTNGSLPSGTTSAVLYESSLLGGNGGLLYVPKGREITFTLVENDDGTLTLSYVAAVCPHPTHSVNGICYTCGDLVAHSFADGFCSCGTSCFHVWENGSCTACGMACSHSWSEGVCGTCGLVCGHEWADSTCTVCGKVRVLPTLTMGSPSVSFEGQVQYNIYFTLENAEGIPLSDMGLLTWSSPKSSGTIDDAQNIIPGAVTDGTQYMVHSQGISAKNLADALYFKIYIRLEDGTYLYSDMKGYSAKIYGQSMLNRSSDEYLRALCVAMLNYGAEAQTFFNYKSYDLMNSALTAEQQDLVDVYSASFVDDLVAVDSGKVGQFVYTPAGYADRRPSVSFDGAFSINYYFTTTHVPEGDVTLYYWNYSDYLAANTLTAANATGSMTMTLTDTENQYWANVADIAAKELDQTLFVAAVYTSGGNTYCTGVLNYSVGYYCETMTQTQNDMTALAMDTAMYGYYAKQYLKNLYG